MLKIVADIYKKMQVSIAINLYPMELSTIQMDGKKSK